MGGNEDRVLEEGRSVGSRVDFVFGEDVKV